METDFEINVNYKGKERLFRADYMSTGFSYKINVDVDGQIISFEPDEERNFRALLDYDTASQMHSIDSMLVEAIAKELIALFKDVG